MRQWKLLLLTAGLQLPGFACGGERESGAPEKATVKADSSGDDSARDTTRVTARVDMRGVAFHLPHDVVLQIDRLEGRVMPVALPQPISFDDPGSFVLEIEQGEIALSTAALATLMNDWVFARDDAPLRDFAFGTGDGHLRIRGKLHKIVNIGFEIVADLTLTEAGQIRARPVDIEVLGFLGEGFLRRIGLSLDDLIPAEPGVGVRVEGNDLYLDPERILPPPRMHGRLTGVRVETGRLVQVFGDTTGVGAVAATSGNYMRFEGGTLAFGRMTMTDGILLVIDQDPDDVFDFSLERYAAQLIAGYSRTRTDLGLDVYMPDLADVDARAGSIRTRPQ